MQHKSDKKPVSKGLLAFYIALSAVATVLLVVAFFLGYRYLTRPRFTQDMPDPTNWAAMYRAGISVGDPLGRKGWGSSNDDFGY